MMSPWHGLMHCSDCNGLHREAICPVCGHAFDNQPQIIVVDGVEHLVPQATHGAIPWSTFLILERIKIEGERSRIAPSDRPERFSHRFTVVLLFWTLFEVLIDGFYRAALADLPGQLDDELLERFSGIGGRLDRLYRRIWQTNFWADLEAEGFSGEATLLRRIQKARNAFVHGDPEAIGDDLVDATLAHLENVQKAWIILFNKRCTGRRQRVPIWQSAQERASLRSAS
ncbi:hypothetical protein [Sphingobium sp. Sx8-8]|uniref:hypothetical protein n=1 Tax=Sphingobium sp. Sx8-8 TaxID=2933617 RepID=UPI001F5AB813|nr:hypothetical protein [Sphingobium sp. Sx8-8]